MTSVLTTPEIVLPAHIDEALLVPDPHKRAGVWYFEPTDDVISLPPNWRPQSGPFAAKSGPAPVDAKPYSMLTPSDLVKMNKGQMTAVAQALGIEGIDKISKADGMAAILLVIEAQKAEPATPTTGEGDGAGEPAADLTGKSVVVLRGPLSGKIGVVSEMGDADAGDDFALRVITQGQEFSFHRFEDELRFATDEEIAAAAEAAAK